MVCAGGMAQEIVTTGSLDPRWRFTAVDPSQPMLDLAVARLKQLGMIERTNVHLGYVDDLHHLPGDEAKRAIL